MLQIVIYKKLNFWEEYTPLVVMVMVFIFMIWRLPSAHAVEKAENEENKNQQNCWGHPCKIIIIIVSGLPISVQNYYFVVDTAYMNT